MVYDLLYSITKKIGEGKWRFTSPICFWNKFALNENIFQVKS